MVEIIDINYLSKLLTNPNPDIPTSVFDLIMLQICINFVIIHREAHHLLRYLLRAIIATTQTQQVVGSTEGLLARTTFV
jgi:hypothetical protein